MYNKDLKIKVYCGETELVVAPLIIFLGDVGSLVHDLTNAIQIISGKSVDNFYHYPENDKGIREQLEVAKEITSLTTDDSITVLFTHSDSILQQINNLIKLSYCSQEFIIENSLGHLIPSMISDEDIVVYQLYQDKLTRCESTKHGFSAPIFYDALFEAYEESKLLDSGIDE